MMTQRHLAQWSRIDSVLDHDEHESTADVLRFELGLAALFVVLTVLWLCAIVLGCTLVVGHTPFVITSNSMAPRVRVGDVVLVEPHPERASVGHVVAFRDAVRGDVKLHRIVDVRPDGLYVTRGDANPEADSDPLEPERIIGVAQILVPFIGEPAIWTRADPAKLALVFIGTMALLACARWAVEPLRA